MDRFAHLICFKLQSRTRQPTDGLCVLLQTLSSEHDAIYQPTEEIPYNILESVFVAKRIGEPCYIHMHRGTIFLAS